MSKQITNDERRITVRFLGTNGWYDTSTGNTICILIETPKEYVVLDAGNGIYKLDQYIGRTMNNEPRTKPIHLFLSHFHLDHIEGLHILAKFRFKQGMTIYVQKGGKRLLMQIVKQPFTMAFKDLKTKVTIKEFNYSKSPKFLEQALKLKHISPCYGFRFNFEGKVISYVPDTGLCQNAYRLAQGADLLIAECAFKAGQNSNKWPHLNPETAAQLAKKARVKKLVLVHFDAEVYKTTRERKEAGKQARKVFRNLATASDGHKIRI